MGKLCVELVGFSAKNRFLTHFPRLPGQVGKVATALNDGYDVDDTSLRCGNFGTKSPGSVPGSRLTVLCFTAAQYAVAIAPAG